MKISASYENEGRVRRKMIPIILLGIALLFLQSMLPLIRLCIIFSVFGNIIVEAIPLIIALVWHILPLLAVAGAIVYVYRKIRKYFTK